MDTPTTEVLEALELTLESLDGLEARLDAPGTDAVARHTLAAVERLAEAVARLEAQVVALGAQVADVAGRLDGVAEPPAPAAGPVRAAFWSPPRRLRSVTA